MLFAALLLVLFVLLATGLAFWAVAQQKTRFAAAITALVVFVTLTVLLTLTALWAFPRLEGL